MTMENPWGGPSSLDPVIRARLREFVARRRGPHGSDGLRAFDLDVGHHNAARSFLRQPSGQALANATGATGHDGHFFAQVHGSFLQNGRV